MTLTKTHLIWLGLLLAACAPSAPEAVEQDPPVESAATSSSSSVASWSESSIPAIPLEQALDAEFMSQKLGIAVRYPSIALVGDCTEPVPIHVRETDHSLEFVVEQRPDVECMAYAEAVQNVIYARRVADVQGLRAFIDLVFSPDCEIAEESPYEANGDAFTTVFLHSKHPPTDGLDLACEHIVWNRTAGVAMFSPMGSKTGGGIDWPSPTPIVMPDGSLEYMFDFRIMESIRYVKP